MALGLSNSTPEGIRYFAELEKLEIQVSKKAKAIMMV